MEKLKQLSNGHNKLNYNLSSASTSSHRVKQQQQQQQQQQQKKMSSSSVTQTKPAKTVDIDFLHKVIFDINSKLDSNIYWLTTLLQNIILSIETLNKKQISLDKRLEIIENSKTSPTANNVNVNELFQEFKTINNNNDSNIKHTNSNDSSGNSNSSNGNFNNSINSLDDSNDTIIENSLTRNVVLRRRTTIQISDKSKIQEEQNFRRDNRLSQPIITTQNRRFSYTPETPTTIKISKTSLNKLSNNRVNELIEFNNNNGKSSPKTRSPLTLKKKTKEQINNDKRSIQIIDKSNNVLETSSDSTTNNQNNSLTDLITSIKASTKQRNSLSIASSSDNKENSKRRSTDTDQESLDNFIELAAEETESEIEERAQRLAKLGITSANSSHANEIIKFRNKKISNTKKENLKFDTMNKNNNASDNRIIKRFKILKDGPFEFVLDIIDGELVVMEIFEGGIIHRHGGVKVGDVLLTANGLKLSGKTFNEAQLRLEKAMEDGLEYIELVVARNMEQDDEEITAL